MKRLIWLLLIGQCASGETLLRVRPHIVVAPESEVKLSQLIEAPELSIEGRAKASKISVVKAPAAGEQHSLTQASLMDVLRPIVQDERARTGRKVHLVMPKQVTIDTVKREITAALVTEELLQAWSPLCANCRLEIEALSLPKVQGVRDWTLKLKAELPRGSFSVPVNVIREDGAMVPAWVSGRLIVKKQVPVAKRMIAPQERIQAQDIVWEYRDTSLSIDGIPGEDELPGKLLKQGVRAGEIIWQSQVEKEKAIRRGDLVQVRAGSANWEVSLNVISQQDAFIGDVVNLKHPKNGNVLVGQVVGRGEVELR